MTDLDVPGMKPRTIDPKTVRGAAVEPPTSLFVRLKRERTGDQESLQRPSISYWQDAWHRLAKNKVAVASAVYIVVLAVMAMIVPEVISYSADEQEIWNKHRTPTLGEEALVVEDIDAVEAASEATLSDVAAGESAVALDGTMPTPLEPPAAPANLRVVGETLTTGVTVAWDAVPGVDGYRVYRSIAADTLGIPVEDIPPERTTYHDRSSLNAGTELYYHVTAFNAFGDSADAAVVGTVPRLALRLADALKLDASATVGSRVLTKPHYLGTDYLGRDLLARVLMGARVSLFIGVVAPLLYIFFGIVWGSISGYFGGVVDNVMMRIADVVATVPELLVVILLQVMLGSGVVTLIIAMVAVAWSRSAQQVRGEVLRLREAEFVQAAKILGTSFRKTVFRHLLPNVMGTILVLLTLAVPGAIFTEAFLSFIGLGIHPPMTSWGIVTKEGARVFLTYPHELMIPSALICVTMLAFNLLGDGLRDALDPKLRGTR